MHGSDANNESGYSIQRKEHDRIIRPTTWMNCGEPPPGEVSELADERGLGPRAARRAGSSPAFPTSRTIKSIPLSGKVRWGHQRRSPRTELKCRIGGRVPIQSRDAARSGGFESRLGFLRPLGIGTPSTSTTATAILIQHSRLIPCA